MTFVDPETLSSEELGGSCLEAYTLLRRLKEAERLYVEACSERDSLAMHPDVHTPRPAVVRSIRKHAITVGRGIASGAYTPELLQTNAEALIRDVLWLTGGAE